MDNINETYKKRLKKGLKLSLLYRTNTAMNKSLEIVKFSPKLFQKFNIQYNHNNKENIFPKKMNITNEFLKIQKMSFNNNINNNNNTTQFPSILYRNAINQFLNKSMNEKNYIIPKKIDASTQNNINIDSFILKIRKIPNIKSNFFKNLIEYIPQKNLNDIDYVIESPYRGVEKIYSSSMSHSISNERKRNNIYKSIYIHNNNKSCSSLKKNGMKNKEIFDTCQRQENSKRDKYIEINKNKEIENPLEKISKLSGMSCYKLRQVIDYSLKNYVKIISIHKNERSKTIKKFKNNNKINNNINSSNNNNIINDNNLNKTRHSNISNLYSIITLKSNRKHKYNKINENLTNLYNESSYENIISSKKRNNI